MACDGDVFDSGGFKIQSATNIQDAFAEIWVGPITACFVGVFQDMGGCLLGVHASFRDHGRGGTGEIGRRCRGSGEFDHLISGPGGLDSYSRGRGAEVVTGVGEVEVGAVGVDGADGDDAFDGRRGRRPLRSRRFRRRQK